MKISSKVTYAGLFIAIGVLLPMIFHLVGVGGTIILPMHIPVIMSGFYLGGRYGLLVGMITPIISHLVTGMPPITPVPMLYIMIFELGGYGFLTGLIFKNTNKISYSLLGGMVGGRIIAGIVVWLLSLLFGFSNLASPIIFVGGAVITGLPGIILQLILIPLIVPRTVDNHTIQQEGNYGY
ncbi:ECF transporter S component [Natranaerobius trueperi]|uniref:ECF transporter S component n=1 Tax=Natranaerobius trueperi TaxID=759412 RepID=A0A226BXI6_9FIRM|nr:ECF transporter S component [Natranaerobius trueperi]OWZ83706.1 ECF transporter S component [Natranaerobius trueperi]